MPTPVIYEMNLSRNWSISRDAAQIERHFVVLYTMDELEVKELALNYAAVDHFDLTMDNVKADPKGGGVWEVVVVYVNLPELNKQFSFDTTGQTIHITQSKETIYRRSAADKIDYGSAMTSGISTADAVVPGVSHVEAGGITVVEAQIGLVIKIISGTNWIPGVYRVVSIRSPAWILDRPACASLFQSGGVWEMYTNAEDIGLADDLKQAIGVTTDSVEGVDIFAPKLDMTFERYRPNCTGAYLLTLFNLTGKTNDALFFGFPIGSVLYLGATGSFTRKDRWTITHKFACSRNESGIDLGNNVIIPEKGGWEYLHVGYNSERVGNKMYQLPFSAYVERVYDAGDMLKLEIGGDSPVEGGSEDAPPILAP